MPNLVAQIGIILLVVLYSAIVWAVVMVTVTQARG